MSMCLHYSDLWYNETFEKVVEFSEARRNFDRYFRANVGDSLANTGQSRIAPAGGCCESDGGEEYNCEATTEVFDDT